MQPNFVTYLNPASPMDHLVDAGIPAPVDGSSSAPPFSSLIKDAVSSVQNLEDQASSAVEGVMNGSGVDIHQAMIATQKADLSFEMALAVRNKAVAAYQQVMQMQF